MTLAIVPPFWAEPTLSGQDSDAGQMGGWADVLNPEAWHGCARIRLRGFNYIFQVGIKFLQKQMLLLFLFLGRIEMTTAFLMSQKLNFFSQFVKSWTSMEHDNNWEPKVGENYIFVGRWKNTFFTIHSIETWNTFLIIPFHNLSGTFRIHSYLCWKVKNTLKKLPWGDRVTPYLVPRDMPSKSFEGNEEEYRFSKEHKIQPTTTSWMVMCRSYIDKPASLGRKFDLIIGGYCIIMYEAYSLFIVYVHTFYNISRRQKTNFKIELLDMTVV